MTKFYHNEMTPKQLWPEIEEYFYPQWRELAPDQERVPMLVDLDVYQRAWFAGMLHIVTGRNEDGKLVAYAAFFLRQHPHYAGTLMAYADTFYVTPDSRGAMLGMRLIKESLKALKARKIKVVYTYAKFVNQLGRIFERVGMAPTEVCYRINTEDFHE